MRGVDRLEKTINMKEGLFAEVGYTMHKSENGEWHKVPLFMEVPKGKERTNDEPDKREKD